MTGEPRAKLRAQVIGISRLRKANRGAVHLAGLPAGANKHCRRSRRARKARAGPSMPAKRLAQWRRRHNRRAAHQSALRESAPRAGNVSRIKMDVDSHRFKSIDRSVEACRSGGSAQEDGAASSDSMTQNFLSESKNCTCNDFENRYIIESHGLETLCGVIAERRRLERTVETNGGLLVRRGARRTGWQVRYLVSAAM